MFEKCRKTKMPTKQGWEDSGLFSLPQVADLLQPCYCPKPWNIARTRLAFTGSVRVSPFV
jgi:hypothetical protein